MSNLGTDSETYDSDYTDTDEEMYEETDFNFYYPEEPSLTKYNFVICELYSISKNNKYYLTHFRFRKYNYREAERIIQYLQSTSKIEIAECIYLPSQHCVSILKTFWLRLIQRKWKKIINERKLIIIKRCNPNSIKYREIHGIWPNNCFIYPTLKGMLSNL
jgi:hypothetical protein